MPTEPEHSARPVITVFDDDPILRRAAALALRSAGLAVEESRGGDDAIQRFLATRPDFVLLGLAMPYMNGFATCAALRRLRPAANSPMVFLNGHNDTDAIHATDEDATDFVTKPFNAVLLGHGAWCLLRGSAALKKIERSCLHLASARRLANMGSWEWDSATRRLQLSEVACRNFGLPATGFRGTLHGLPAQVSSSSGRVLKTIFDERGIAVHSYHRDHRITLGDGTDRLVHIQARAVRFHEEGLHPPLTATPQDLTQRRHLEDHFHHLADYDSPTGLLHRSLVRDRGQQALEQATRHASTVAVLFLDVDRFKVINDTFGQAAGDMLLTQAAQRLTEVTCAGDSVGRSWNEAPEHSVARLGGDEFTVLLTDLRLADHVTLATRRILSFLDGQEVFVTGSIGIAHCRADGGTSEELVKNADTAMYQARSVGRNHGQYYSRSVNARLAEGIDPPEQVRLLKRHGCDEIQDYLLGKPVATEAFSTLLQRSLVP